MLYFFLLFGAIWRLVDGGDNKPKFWAGLPALFIPALFILGGWQLTLSYIIGWVSLLSGFHGWHKFSYMRMRYTGYAALACALAGTSLWYILVAFLAGMTYPTLHLLHEKKIRLPYFWRFNNYNSYCEVICGAGMIGCATMV